MSLLYEVIYVFDDTITKPKINWFPCAEAKKVKSRKAEEDYIYTGQLYPFLLLLLWTVKL